MRWDLLGVPEHSRSFILGSSFNLALNFSSLGLLLMAIKILSTYKNNTNKQSFCSKLEVNTCCVFSPLNYNAQTIQGFVELTNKIILAFLSQILVFALCRWSLINLHIWKSNLKVNLFQLKVKHRTMTKNTWMDMCFTTRKNTKL